MLNEVHIFIGIIVITYLMFVYKDHFENFNLHLLIIIMGIFFYEKSDDLQKGFRHILKSSKKEEQHYSDISSFMDRLGTLVEKSPRCTKIIDSLKNNIRKFYTYHKKLMNRKRLSIRMLNILATRLKYMECIINELYLNTDVDVHKQLHALNDEYERIVNRKYDELYQTHYSYKQAIKISLMNI